MNKQATLLPFFLLSSIINDNDSHYISLLFELGIVPIKQLSTTHWQTAQSMLSLLGNQMRNDLTPLTTPTDFELSELQAELDAENGDDSHRHESIQNELDSDANVDDWVDYMLHGLLEDIQYWFLLWGYQPSQ